MYGLLKTKEQVWRDVAYLRTLFLKVDNTLEIFAHAENFVVQGSKFGLNIVPIGRSGEIQTISSLLKFLKSYADNIKITLDKENFSFSLGIDGDVFADLVEPSV